MPGGSKQQTTQANNAPWSTAQPYLADSMATAQNYLKTGTGAGVYQPSTVVPLSEQTQSGQNMAEHVANQNYETLSGNVTRMEQLAGQDGLSDYQRQSIDQLNPMAAGDMLVKNNPFTQAVVDRTGEQMSHQINEMAGASGRYGSGAHQGVLAREIGDMANQAYSNDYNNERRYMQDAIGSIFNAGQMQRDNKIADNAALYDATQARLTPAQTLYEVGAINEDLGGREIQDDLARFQSSQNAQWDNLARANAIFSGAGSLGGSSTQTTQSPSGGSAWGALPLGLGLLGQTGIFG